MSTVLSKALVAVQVVRRFGEVGGMETYVWQLAHSLIHIKIPVIVICEEVLQSHNPSIQVIRVKKTVSKPRWLALYCFGVRARKRYLQLISDENTQNFIVHSHERCDFHHVTTFHGPPFAGILEQRFWKRFSIRVFAHLRLERREVLATSVRDVVPNSEIISQDLLKHYPSVKSRLHSAISPGVPRFPQRLTREIDPRGGSIGFIGKEWKRKGLAFFLLVCTELMKLRPNIEMIILGPEESEIAHLVKNCPDNIKFLGWQPSHAIFPTLDLLIHPASIEPYGMVVAEAMAAGVPVLVSDNSGVCPDVVPSRGSVLSLSDLPGTWAASANSWLAKSHLSYPAFRRDWQSVANEYAVVYSRLQCRKNQVNN